MKGLIIAFLIWMVGYHLVHTLLGYGLGWIDPIWISISKDLIWIVLVVVVCIVYWSTLRRSRWIGRLMIALFVLVVSSWWVSYVNGIDLSVMLIGAKYDLYPLVVIVTGVILGMTVWRGVSTVRLLAVAMRWLSYVLVIGLIWQLGKLLAPDFFARFGYGPVGDYLVGEAPPLYYRTGPGGVMRLQGIFAGPNNYGYFLVGRCSLLVWYISQHWSDLARRPRLVSLSVVYLVSLIWTLSRGALLGVLVQLVVLAMIWSSKLRRWIWLIGAGCLIAVVGLSVAKPLSTIAHLSARVDGRQAFVANPRGYGLGTAGPSIHFAGVYLPENHYLQILLDIGIGGFVGRVVLLAVILWPWYRDMRDDARRARSLQRIVTSLLVLGFGGLLVEGWFLHVLEDSMVTYLFLVPLGISLGRQYWLSWTQEDGE